MSKHFNSSTNLDYVTLEAAANGLESTLRRRPFALRKNLDRLINKSVEPRWIEPIERVRKRQLDGRVGPKRLSGKPKLPSCEHGSWYVVPQAIAAIEQRSRPYLQGIDIADDAEIRNRMIPLVAALLSRIFIKLFRVRER